MPKLRDGSVVVVWPRHSVVLHPEIPFVTVEPELNGELAALAYGRPAVACSAHLAALVAGHVVEGAAGEEDPILRAELARLDRAYAGWVPGLWAAEHRLIEEVESMHARRRVLLGGRAAWPTLPSSTVRRALALGRVEAGSILLDEDHDGLGILLARHAEVTVVEPSSIHRDWLRDEAHRAGVSERLRLEARWPEATQVDLTVLQAGPAGAGATLARALAATRAGGRIAVRVRRPLDTAVREQVVAAGLPVRAHHHDLEHWLLPGPAVGAAGDLLLLDRPAGAALPGPSERSAAPAACAASRQYTFGGLALPAPSEPLAARATGDVPQRHDLAGIPVPSAREQDSAAAEAFRSQPSLAIDLDGLAAERLGPRTVEQLADLATLQSTRPEEVRAIYHEGDRDVLCWYDDRGIGFTAELRRHERHMLLTLLPYDVVLEQAVLAAVYQTAADGVTRPRRAGSRVPRHGSQASAASGDTPHAAGRTRPSHLGDAVSRNRGRDNRRLGAPAGTPGRAPLYHLGDGVVLGVGSRDARLLDVETGEETNIDVRFIEPLEQVSLGWSMEGHEPLVPRLLQDHLLAEGPAGADPVLRARLREMDGMFMPSYEGALDARARRAYELTLEAHARRKRFFTRVGQCPTLPETSLRRALLVGDARDRGEKRVLCVGDDDLVSVALAALGHRVTVYDIDDYLLRFLRQTAAELGLAIEVVERDLRDPLPRGTGERFDLFLTDPMSNRDCFELFLSRALTLVAPGGRGFVAVYAPTARLFRRIAAEMRLPIVAWHARHNRYYSQYMQLHSYESDWVELRKTAATVVKHPPDAFCVPVNLYREQLFQRRPTYLAFYDDIEDTRHAMPVFLDLLVDVLERRTGLELRGRLLHPGEEDWSVLHGATAEGHLTLHVDRRRRQITAELFPMQPQVEEALRSSLMAAYKRAVTRAQMTSSRELWELRIR